MEARPAAQKGRHDFYLLLEFPSNVTAVIPQLSRWGFAELQDALARHAVNPHTIRRAHKQLLPPRQCVLLAGN